MPIRDLACCFPHAYATSPRQIRVCLETYFLTKDLAHAEFLSSLPSVHTVETSDLVHQTIFYQAQLHQVIFHHLHQVGCLSRTTLNNISHQIYIIYQVHQVKHNFIRWIAIKDNTCQQSHVFIFIQWVAIKDNTLHHISNNLPLWT